MNARIKLLAEQAYDELVEETGNIVVFDEDFQQRFAQLIVKECLEACSRANEIRHFVPPTQEQVVLSCMREIKQHFGVEE